MLSRGIASGLERRNPGSASDRKTMPTQMPEHRPKLSPVLAGVRNIVGVGMYLLLLGLLLEGITLVIQRWASLPIPLTLRTQVSLTVPCVTACLVGVIWFNRSLNLIRVHLLNGKARLITHGPFAYVRHPLYSTVMMTVPPLIVIWLADYLFFIPWALVLIVSHYVVRLEERGLMAAFGEDYERYRRHVPALLPYKGAGGRRYR